MKLLKNIKNIFMDMQEYFKDKIDCRKKDKYRIISGETNEMKNQKITKNLKRDFIVLLIVAAIGAGFAIINMNANKVIHINANKIENITIINYILANNTEAKSMTVDKETDIKKIVTNFNSIKKVSSISKINEITENVVQEDEENILKTNDEIIFILDYKKENKEDTVLILLDGKLYVNGKEYFIDSKENDKVISSIGSMWYLFNYNVDAVSEEDIKNITGNIISNTADSNVK